jgi:hypothetical protein
VEPPLVPLRRAIRLRWADHPPPAGAMRRRRGWDSSLGTLGRPTG